MRTGDAGKDKGRGKRPFKRRGKTADRTKLVDQQSLLSTAPLSREDRHAFEDFVASPFGRCLLRRRRGAHPSDGSDQRGRLDHRRRREGKFPLPPEREDFSPAVSDRKITKSGVKSRDRKMSQNRREEEHGQKETERRRMEEPNKIKPKNKIRSRPTDPRPIFNA